jgi:V/A-type H+-transporting ATPase subunit D
MAKKVRLTRPELKRQRDALTRFERYLPMLKLKQQQLQLTMRDVLAARGQAQAAVEQARRVFEPYRAVLADLAGINVRQLARPKEVRTTTTNVAGVNIPVFQDVVFPEAAYSLFATPAWVDRALADLRTLNRHMAELGVLDRQYELLARELTKIIQRVNLFEKVKIPESREIIRVIRIKLGDEMTAAVGRAKIAKSKIAEASDRFDREGDAAGVEEAQEP